MWITKNPYNIPASEGVSRRKGVEFPIFLRILTKDGNCARSGHNLGTRMVDTFLEGRGKFCMVLPPMKYK